MDLLTQWDPIKMRGDLVLAGPSLAQDDGLGTAVLISLFTDRKARPDDVLPSQAGGATPAGVFPDRRGWWGDFLVYAGGSPATDTGSMPQPLDRIGSRLWLLSREKQLQSVVENARLYALEALEWITDNKIADSVDVYTEITAPGVLGLRVTITRGSAVEQHQYDYAWSNT
jgi:phage gp46-like protein